MALTISPVRNEEVDLLMRNFDFPGQRNNPLYGLMFPRANEQQRARKTNETTGATDKILKTLDREDSVLYKICGMDGLPVGLIGWTRFSHGESSGGNGHRYCLANKPGTAPGANVEGGNSLYSPSASLNAWPSISRRFDEESQKVFRDYQSRGVCRITTLSVKPNYQRQGVGSQLVEMFCHDVEEDECDAYVLTPPAGIRLYENFGFMAVGVVETQQGTFTSMLRKSKMF
jgi:ribosomal protein S18 acetylase RimI-like enzyme